VYNNPYLDDSSSGSLTQRVSDANVGRLVREQQAAEKLANSMLAEKAKEIRALLAQKQQLQQPQYAASAFIQG